MNPANVLKRLDEAMDWVEYTGGRIYDWFTEDWWLIPIIAVAIVVFVTWFLTGGFNHFNEWPFR